MREHKGDGSVDPKGGIMEVLEDIEVEETVGFGFIDSGTSSRTEG